jgi:hypothetical protein
VLAVDWTSLTVAGGFGVGLLLGCIITIRLLRIAIDVIKREQRDE